jgi:hypothetical protein
MCIFRVQTLKRFWLDTGTWDAIYHEIESINCVKVKGYMCLSCK